MIAECLEEVITFDCSNTQLVGILSLPRATTCHSTAVVVIVGGPQYRAGSHRQFVLLSRTLAAAGYPVLRFDNTGMGDSLGDQRGFLQITPDIASAIDALLKRQPQVSRIALWGLCDAASAALLYWHDTRDRRICGICLLNPWVRSQVSLATTQVKHYYFQRLLQREFWKKLAEGGVALGALAGFTRAVWVAIRHAPDKKVQPNGKRGASRLPMPYQQRMAATWQDFPGRLLLVLSGADYTAKEFLEYTKSDSAWSRALTRQGVVRHDLAGADHTFSDSAMSALVASLTIDWLKTPSIGDQI